MAFNGDGAVRAWGTSDTSANNTKSYGISSLADSGTGRLGVTMSVASSDHHYCVITNHSKNGNTNPNEVTYIFDNTSTGGSSKNTTTFEIRVNSATGGINDFATDYYFAIYDDF
tara:strand:- start:464 stop:805 length:342 start_codon:yes stop_codon:yes gene_type:complete